jgi:hypothetical protein
LRPKPYLLAVCLIIITIFLIYFLSPSLYTKHSEANISLRNTHSLADISSLHLESFGNPLCLILLDTRSNIAVGNSARLLQYFASCPVKVEPMVSYVNSAPGSEFTNSRRLERNAIKGYNYLKDSLYFYDRSGKLRYKSPLTRDIKAILTDLDEILLGKSWTNDELELVVGKNLQELTLGSIVHHSFEQGHFQFYLIFSDICLGCKSGNSLMELSDYCKKDPRIGLTFIAVNEYSNRDIVDFKQQHGINAEIVIPSSEFIESWRNSERQMERIHPWDGMILVVNPLGVIVYKSKTARDCINWVGDQIEREVR